MTEKRLRRSVGDDPPSARLLYGVDAREGLRLLPPNSVQCVVTSPPYFGLRDYGRAGQIGLEDTPEAYVESLVEVFREVKRVLRTDGTVWLNLGDSYSSSPHDGATLGVKPKDLLGIPWEVALALRKDGWYLRQDVVWHKGACMPESITDRFTKSHEYVFLLAHPNSGGRYFFDSFAVREKAVGKPQLRLTKRLDHPKDTEHPRLEGSTGTETRVRRSVWLINPRSYHDAHFATFPPELPELCIRAGTSEKGACPSCGAPWTRLVSLGDVVSEGGGDTGTRATNMHAVLGQSVAHAYNTGKMVQRDPVSAGWEPGCACPHPAGVKLARCVVLDPFSGSGTTGMAAMDLGRDYVGTDLNEEYLPMAEVRVLATGTREVEPPPEVGDFMDLFGDDA